jgi:hypothetical protein
VLIILLNQFPGGNPAFISIGGIIVPKGLKQFPILEKFQS